MQTNWKMISCNAENIYESWIKIKSRVCIKRKTENNSTKLNAGVPFGVSTFSSTECLIHIVLPAYK